MGVSGSRIAPRPPGVPAPPSADTERYPDATPNPVKRTADQPVSTFSIDVDTAAYANVRRFIDNGRAPPRDAVRVEEMINYFDYGYARPTSAARPFAVTTSVAASPWAPGRLSRTRLRSVAAAPCAAARPAITAGPARAASARHPVD